MSAVGVVQLAHAEKIDLSKMKSAQDCITSASNPEILTELEELVTIWCKQIEQV